MNRRLPTSSGSLAVCKRFHGGINATVELLTRPVLIEGEGMMTYSAVTDGLAKERIATAVDVAMRGTTISAFLSMPACDDHPWKQSPPDMLTPSLFRATLLDELRSAPDGPSKLTENELAIARRRLSVKWEADCHQMIVGWRNG